MFYIIEIKLHFGQVRLIYQLKIINKALLKVCLIFLGYEVKFEIYKSSGATSFMMVPHYGEVPPCRGSQKSFVNVFIYFCPK